MDKSERYLKDIAKNTAEIAKELKRINRKPEVEHYPDGRVRLTDTAIEEVRKHLKEQDAIDDNIKF